jgi:hypothetical protein
MQAQYTPDPLLEPLRRHLRRPQWQNLLALVLAVQFARTLIQRQLALFLLCSVFSPSCYRRLSRLLAWGALPEEAPANAARPTPRGPDFRQLQRLWVRAVVACFAPGRGTLILLLDWTLHRDRCRSLWVMLPVGGRAVPLAFWLAGTKVGGKGAQRQLEDEALTELAGWLGKRRRVVLVGDRGFRGADRMRFLKQLGWHFVLRVTGDTMVRLPGQAEWVTLSQVPLPLGSRWQEAGVEYG